MNSLFIRVTNQLVRQQDAQQLGKPYIRYWAEAEANDRKTPSCDNSSLPGPSHLSDTSCCHMCEREIV